MYASMTEQTRMDKTHKFLVVTGERAIERLRHNLPIYANLHQIAIEYSIVHTYTT